MKGGAGAVLALLGAGVAVAVIGKASAKSSSAPSDGGGVRQPQWTIDWEKLRIADPKRLALAQAARDSSDEMLLSRMSDSLKKDWPALSEVFATWATQARIPMSPDYKQIDLEMAKAMYERGGWRKLDAATFRDVKSPESEAISRAITDAVNGLYRAQAQMPRDSNKALMTRPFDHDLIRVVAMPGRGSAETWGRL